MNREIAILLAAGKGIRMFPLTMTTPKPLIRVHESTMIETVIRGLLYRGISHIYVVVGYLKEQFDYLPDVYPQVELVENPEFEVKNNISSIYAVADLMGKEDCFICEADLYIPDPSIFGAELKHSCYYGKMVPGHSDDWVFDLVDGRITRIGKCGDDGYNSCGISHFKKQDAQTIADAVKEAYKHPGHEQLLWDEIANQQLDRIDLRVHPVLEGQIVEIDSVEELKTEDPAYASYENEGNN